MKIGELFLTILAGAIAVVYMTSSMETVVMVVTQSLVVFCVTVLVISIAILLSRGRKGRKESKK